MIARPAWIALLLLASSQEAKNANPDLYFLQEWGVSVNKPPKKEEWEFKTSKGKLQNSQLIVGHRVEDLSIEIFVQAPPVNTGLQVSSYDPKDACEKEYEFRSTSEGFKDVKKVKLENVNLPGKGAGGVRAWYLEMTMKDNTDATLEWRMYAFVGRENQCFYKIMIIGGEKIFEKNKREVDFILSTVRIWRLPKKK